MEYSRKKGRLKWKIAFDIRDIGHSKHKICVKIQRQLALYMESYVLGGVYYECSKYRRIKESEKYFYKLLRLIPENI